MTTDSVADLRALMLCAGWDVQRGGRVLCPARGAFASLSPDRRRVLVQLPSGTRTVVEVGRRVRLVRPPAVRMVDGVTLRAVGARAWRDESVVLEAAAALRAFGSASGVFGRPDWASGDWSLSAEDDAGRWVNVRRTLRDREAAWTRP